MNTIKRQIAANNALVVHFDFVVKSSARNTLTKYVRKLGMIKNKTYNSDQERMDDEYVDSEDDEVIIQRLKQQLEAKNCVMDGKSRVIEELKSDKLKQQQTVQELQRIHVKDIQRLKQQLDAQIQALETNVANISAHQQRNFVQLKESLSFSGNDNSQRFVWFQPADDEKKANDIEVVKIVGDDPTRIAFVDGTVKDGVNGVLSLAPPVNNVDGISKCNKQILNGVTTLMKGVCDEFKLFEYQSDFDRNGICYALATDFGTNPWQNPMEQDLITVYSLHGWGRNSQAKQVVARDVTTTNHTQNSQNVYIRIFFNSNAIQPTAYTWRHDTCSNYYPRNWNFEGSNDDSTWDVLTRHVNDEHINAPKASHTWKITNCTKSYKMFRFKSTGKNSFRYDRYNICCGGFEIYGRLKSPIYGFEMYGIF